MVRANKKFKDGICQLWKKLQNTKLILQRQHFTFLNNAITTSNRIFSPQFIRIYIIKFIIRHCEKLQSEKSVNVEMPKRVLQGGTPSIFTLFALSIISLQEEEGEEEEDEVKEKERQKKHDEQEEEEEQDK
ncbi:hypothetical protein FQA39_LY04529 [Lamprigera yunnana]|nr:hypothetical protein FQA39_LY04529 [Lamprigera yunnana]